MERNTIKDRFKGKVAVVTGGASGIGRAIIEELCKEGASVSFSDLSDRGYKFENELTKNKHDSQFLRGDMMDEEFCKTIIDLTVKKWGKINYLVNNAFSFLSEGIAATTEDWHRIYFAGPVAYARMVQNVVPHMKKEKGGSIVNISSISAHIAQVNRWTYNSAKAAVSQMTKCQALDLAKHDIRVNSVSPGWIWSPEVNKAAMLDGGGRAKWEPVWGQFHMLERCGDPIECAGPVLFLLSDDASFVTAADLPIDGGYLGMGPEGLGKASIIAGSK